jgi:DNA-binding PucR family transcriptional regulator
LIGICLGRRSPAPSLDGAFEGTARKLLIHRSTLRYRLGRIEKLSGRTLDDPDHRFNLALACRAWISLNASGG